MSGSIIENLSGRKLAVLISALFLGQFLTFLLGGLIAPAPTSVLSVLRSICLDRNYDNSSWYWSRGKDNCHLVPSINSPEITNKGDVTGDNIIFVFQIPLPKDGIQLDYSRWQQSIISMLMIDVPADEEHELDANAVLTIDARLAYRNKEDKPSDWKLLAHSIEERKLECSLPEGLLTPSTKYDCSPLPLFELGSLHHDFYLVNLRLPNFLPGSRVQVNQHAIEVDEITAVFINQNGGFTKVWVSLKTVFLPIISGLMAWFWNRISKLSRPAALLEYMLMILGAALTLLNIPLEYISLFADCPWMTLVTDIRQGLFYAALLSFWLIFAGEHLTDDTERNRIRVYWRHLSAVLTGCVCLFMFDMCERGVQLNNPFYSIWVSETGTHFAMAFIIIAGICAALYFCFLCYMIYKVFINIGHKRRSLPAMTSNRRLKYEGIIYRFKALMLATLLCAAVTVAAFIMGQVSEGQRWEEGNHIQYSSAFLTGVYGMWNIYTMALICLYAPSHKQWPVESGLSSIHGLLMARDLNSSTGEEIEFSRLYGDNPSERSSLTALAQKSRLD